MPILEAWSIFNASLHLEFVVFYTYDMHLDALVNLSYRFSHL